MSYLYNGTDIFQLCEWGGSATKHAIANSGYKLYGQTFEQFGQAPVTTTTGFLYSGETFTPTGFKLAGTQVVLQNAGCRPRFLGTQLYHQTSEGTRYIHRYSDGEVYVSGTTARDKSGTKISNSLDSMVYPRGVRYCMVRLVGKGGEGGKGTSIPAKPASGGGGGATVVCCIRLPENDYARVIIENSNVNTHLICGTFSVTAGNGRSGGNGDNPGAGGTVSGGAQTADGILIASVSGGAGGGAYAGGGGSGISFTDYAPEGGTVAWSQSGGGSGSGKAGGGGASSIRRFLLSPQYQIGFR